MASDSGNGIHYKIDISKDIKYMDKKVIEKVNKKQLSYDLAQLLLQDINKYVPRDTGDLRDKGYVLYYWKNSNGPGFTIKYRNTKELPYVMYQYYGYVWGPNRPKIDMEDNGLTLKGAQLKHVGWYSPKNIQKRNTGRKFRHSRKKFQIKRGIFKGVWVTITGYTKNRKARPRWIEEAQKHRHDWDSMEKKLIMKVETTCKEALKRR